MMINIENKTMESSFISRNMNKIIYLSFSVIAVIIMFYCSDNTSFWYDEITQVGGLEAITIAEVFQKLLSFNGLTPLWTLSIKIWFEIVPKEQNWLLLLPAIYTSAGIYTICLSAEKISKNIFAGVYAGFISLTSVTIMTSVGMELRAYPMLFLFSSLLIYSWIYKNDEGFSLTKKSIIVFALLMPCLLFVHPIAVLLCFALGSYDFILVLLKRAPIKSLISYFLGAFVYAILFIPIFINRQDYLVNATVWLKESPLEKLPFILFYICGESKFSFAFFFVFSAYLAFMLLRKIIKKREAKFEITAFAISYIVFFCIAVGYIYSAYIRPDSSMFIQRYFAYLLPTFPILIGVGLYYFVKIVNEKVTKANLKRLAFLIPIAIILSFNL
ncbi:MAG: hypothetical protein ACRCUS_09590, partial [Anaerovoracaceae bacterium]